MGSCEEQLPPGLMAYSETLRDLDPLQHRIEYPRARWLARLRENEDLQWLLDRFPEAITRGDISELAREAKRLPTEQSAQRLFLAAMLWGYGTVGYGPYRVSRMLGSPGFGKVVLETLNKVLAGSLVEAYDQCRLQYCGSAFFTKYIYFAGLAAEHQPQPLILDSVLANELGKLGVDVGRLARVTRGPSGAVTAMGRWPEGYLCYLQLMARWADQLHCRTDSVELFLFRQAGRGAG